MERKLTVTFEVDKEKTKRKYTTLNGAYKAAYNWFNVQQESGSTAHLSVSIFGLDSGLETFQYIDEVPWQPKNKKSGDFYRSKEWLSLRFQVLKAHKHICVLCGSTPETGAIMDVDHIKPRSKYPHLALDINNLQILCRVCNLGKSNNDETDFR